MKPRQVFFESLAIFAVSLMVLSGCDRDRATAVCKPHMSQRLPATRTVDVRVGQIQKFHAEPEGCKAGENYGIRWLLGDKVVSYSNDYDFIACSSDIPVGQRETKIKLSAQAVTYAATSTATVERVVASYDWTIRLRNVSKPTRPACYEQAIANIQALETAHTAEAQAMLAEAAQCLDAYLAQYACDFQASYASGLAKAAILGESLYPLYRRRAELKLDDIKQIVSKQIEPIRKNFLVVQQKAPNDFSFFVDGKFEIFAFQDDPNLPGDDTIRFYAQGRHDKGEALFFMAFLNYFDAALNAGIGTVGAVEFIMHTPDNSTPASFAQRMIEALEADPQFLSLQDGDDGAEGAEGRRRYKIAQNSIIQGIEQLSAVFDEVRAETHDQSDDLLRYWDCGKDGVCPATCDYMDGRFFNPSQRADDAEYDTRIYQSCKDVEQRDGSYEDRNFNGKCDEKWTAPDEGECNRAYDEGEVVGIERIAFARNPVERMGAVTEIDKLQKVLKIFRDNVRGPDPLPLDELGAIAGLGDRAVSLGLIAAGIPYPLIRSSEIFVTPTSPRDMVPLYDRNLRAFIIDLESEPFRDVGYDGRSNAEEVAAGTPPHDVPEEDYRRDPAFDDFDPYCNPFCNQLDGRDNDGDGKIDNADRRWEVSKDLGVENNFVFDFIDLPGNDGSQPNGIHDRGEPSEPFDDVGTPGLDGALVGAGNGVWDRAERGHVYPTGTHVGPNSNIQMPPDPPNTTLQDGGQMVFDNYYFFFQDPTFSGAVKFIVDPYRPELDLVSITGESLTDNARLHRFESKVIETLVSFGFRESNAHACVSTKEFCNHWDSPDGSYQ